MTRAKAKPEHQSTQAIPTETTSRMINGAIHFDYDDRFYTATVLLDERSRKKALAATDAAADALHHAGNIFDLMATGMASGFLKSNDAGLISLARVCSDYFAARAQDEGETLYRLAGNLKDATIEAPTNG